jgi:hypothetical protein
MAEWVDRLVSRLPSPPEPDGPAPLIVRLRRVDDRWTRRGPLALVREVPQLGAVLVALLVLGGAITVKSRTHPTPAGANGGPSAAATPDLTADDGSLGPHLGDKVPLYLSAARDRLNRLAVGQPDGVVIAVVSFRHYHTPTEVRDLLGPIPVKRVFYRAAALPLKDTVPSSVAVDDIVADSAREFARVATVRLRESAALSKQAATITNDPAEKASEERDATLYAREAAILKGPCDCVYAVAVRTKLRLLAEILLDQPFVRCIDPGRPGGKIEDYDLTALLPDEKTIVTGGNQA